MKTKMKRWMTGWMLFALALGSGCGRSGPGEEAAGDGILVFTYWEEYFPLEVLETFTEETGIVVEYAGYSSEDEVTEEILAGVRYDVAILPIEQIPRLIRGGAVHPLDYANLPNFKYVSANFRDLVFDPGNRYSVPFRWGTTGLLVREDLVPFAVTRWADLWDPRLEGRVAFWSISRTMLPIALKRLGHSVNTTDPEALEAALDLLITLKASGTMITGSEETIVPELTEGEAWVAVGWAYDAIVAREEGWDSIAFILPEEGTILWGEQLVVPAASGDREGAERFINFLLRPDIAARLVNESGYAAPHDGIEALVHPEILASPISYPPNEKLMKAELTMPLGEAGDALFDSVWERFLSAPGK
ncbi:MAG TPA: spermidine/putrescine ABC transporter substrate-binding protein [Kiritimatiellia bacterium]|nr:spermidine/putrescine ABC transporter substrate-binding protein [Kiritimatiellia bacterium]